MLSKTSTATPIGIEAAGVEVEVDTHGGALPGYSIVGLPNGAVKEGQVRIRTALLNSGYDVGSVRVVVNLAPADVRKDGGAFDLPIAVGIVHSRQLRPRVRERLLVAGELALDGRVRPVRGALLLAEYARARGFAGLVLPADNGAEAALVEGIRVYPVRTLRDAVEVLAGELNPPAPPRVDVEPRVDGSVDFGDVAGQGEARLAAEVAAAGGHNLMLVGPPGSGKTMIARRVGTIMPAPAMDEALETTRIHSVAGLLNGRPLVAERPFRAPHHTCSPAGLVGGGSSPRPGEVSLAHNGVLFLDELPEFQRTCLESLRQPVEDGHATIVRVQLAVTFPARFMMVAAMNPCPCGYRGSTARVCTCGERAAGRYLHRISGPLLDRFDLFVDVQPLRTRQLMEPAEAESSAAIAARVQGARALQAERFRRTRSVRCNGQMNSRQLRRYVALDRPSRRLLERYADEHELSPRVLHRTCKVARTLADLQGGGPVTEETVLQSLSLQRARWESF